MRLLREIRNLMGNYHIKSGLYHYYRCEYKQAEDFLRKALQAPEGIGDADRRTANHYLTLSLIDSAAKREEQGELETAIEQLRTAAAVAGGFPDIRHRIGLLEERLGRLDAAAAEYRKAIELHPGYLDARVALGLCEIKMNRGSDAARTFEAALEWKRRLAEEPGRRGIALLDAGAADAAVELFHETFLAIPQMSRLHLRNALERARHDDSEQALVELDRALEYNRRYPDLHNFRGVVLYELGRFEEAAEAFRASAAWNDRILVPRLNLAFTLVRLDRHAAAEEELEAILAIEPSERAAEAKLAELRQGRPAESRRNRPREAPR